MKLVKNRTVLRLLYTFALWCFALPGLRSQTPQFVVPVVINADQSITYQPTPKGDRISDFSTVGYNYGNSALPDEPHGYQVPVVITLYPETGDQTDRIQAAINYISAKPLVNGFRGSLLLKAGEWDIYSRNVITVKASGVVIRGEGDNPLTGTRIYARGTTTESNSGNTLNSRLITFSGNSNTVNTTVKTLVDAVYIPSGTNVIPITGHQFTANQRVQIRWPGTAAWQKASLYNSTATTDIDPLLTYNRIVTATTPNSITLDAPITSPLDPSYARGYVYPVTSVGNITNVGISNCYLESIYAFDTDENHIWNAVLFQNVEDGFMHDCACRYFAYSIAYLNTSTRKITIDRSECYDGISTLVGGRRYSFVATGEMALISNAITRWGRHSFILNWPAAPGPNVFVDGTSINCYNESGSHAQWNNGGLWDNINITAPSSVATALQVKLERPSANCVAWNCILNAITFEDMPLSPNWSLGSTTSAGKAVSWTNSNSTGSYAYAAPYIGKAEQWSNGTRMSVRSLYENQVEARLGSLNKIYRYAANPPTRVNYLPAISTPAQLLALSGSSWSYRLPIANIVPATKAPGYAVTGLPAGVTVNATTGLISGNLPTVATDTNYNLSISASNLDGKATKAMVLTVKASVPSQIPLTMTLEVDLDTTTSITFPGAAAETIPMVPASRLLAPMIVNKAYVSDINGSVYTASDVPVPVRANLSVAGLTSPVTVTYNGSTTVPTAAGYYDVAATLNDPVYQATATGRLLITNATAATVTLNVPASPSASTPVTATTNQPTLTPVVTYDGSTSFPGTSGFYTAKAIAADPTYYGSAISLVSIGRTSATLAWGNLTLPFTGSMQTPTVVTNPPGLATQVSISGYGVLPGSYAVTASITDPTVNFTPLAGTMVISNPTEGSGSNPVEDWVFGLNQGTTAPGTAWTYSTLTGAQLRSALPDANLYPDGSSYPVITVKVRSTLAGILIVPEACDDLIFGPASTQEVLLVATAVLDANFEQQTYAIVPVAGGPASPRAFLRFWLDYSAQ